VKTLLPLFAIMLTLSSAQAQVTGLEYLGIDLTNSPSEITNATWSEPDKFSTSANGFGWQGSTNENPDYWLQSVPLAIGTSWRPARGVGINVKIEPSSNSVRRFLIRYSPDKKHWSEWQVLDLKKSSVEVPQAARTEYEALLAEYSKMDVPWTSDEESVAKWILQHDPNFFEKHQPFMGYVQFRLEGSLPGNIRIKRIEVFYSWGFSGLHSAPKDVGAYQGREGHWRFETQ
jgi:hypothetical protein